MSGAAARADPLDKSTAMTPTNAAKEVAAARRPKPFAPWVLVAAPRSRTAASIGDCEELRGRISIASHFRERLAGLGELPLERNAERRPSAIRAADESLEVADGVVATACVTTKTA